MVGCRCCRCCRSYAAFFNLGAANAEHCDATLAELGLGESAQACAGIADVWTGKPAVQNSRGHIQAVVEPTSVVLLKLTGCK